MPLRACCRLCLSPFHRCLFALIRSKGLSCVLNNLRTVKPHLLLTLFSGSFDELSIALLLLTSSRERAGGKDVASGVISSELDHSGILCHQDVQCQFENPCYEQLSGRCLGSRAVCDDCRSLFCYSSAPDCLKCAISAFAFSQQFPFYGFH